MNLREFITVKGLKAIGNRLTALPVLNVELLETDTTLENQEEEKLMAELAKKRQATAGAQQLSLTTDEDETESGQPALF